MGKQSPFKYGGIVKPLSAKYAIRKNNEPFTKVMMRSHSAELLRDGISLEQIGLDFSLEPTETVRIHHLVLLSHYITLFLICGDTHLLGCRQLQTPSGCLFKLFSQIRNQKKFHQWAYHVASCLCNVVERINIHIESVNFQVVESLLSKVINEFEHRTASQSELVHSLLLPASQFLLRF